MDLLSTYILILIAMWWLWTPEMERRRKAKSEARLAAQKRQWEELERAIEEHSFWVRNGRPLPHRRHGWDTINIGEREMRVRFDSDKIVEIEWE
jgi:ABC-type nickel/cobalt efflux system permease component RcnA